MPRRGRSRRSNGSSAGTATSSTGRSRPRAPSFTTRSGISSRPSTAQSGFFVYTPLELADGRVVFVNRGFVPYDRKDAATRAQGQVAGPVTISGLARNPLAGKPSSIVPDNEPDKNIFYWKDLRSMATSAGVDPSRLLPFFIDAGPAANPGGLPVGGVTIVDLPNNHLQYAVTWYGLAAALAGVLGVWLWRRRDQART